MEEGEPPQLKGTPTNHQREGKKGQAWGKRNENTHDHRLGGTAPDAVVQQRVVAHLPESISRYVGEASPQAEDMELREDTPTNLQRNPGLGAEHQ